MQNLASRLLESATALAGLATCAADVEMKSDGDLVIALDTIATHQRALDGYKALVAGELGRRSRRELGNAGLAKRSGFVSPEAMIQSVAGTSRQEAGRLVYVGTMLSDIEAADSVATVDPDLSAGPEWRRPLAEALRVGELSIESVESIRRGLGEPDDDVTADLLGAAVLALIDAAGRPGGALGVAGQGGLNPDQLFRRARQLRDEMDVAGIARREREQRELNTFKAWRRVDGRVDFRGSLDAESGTILLGVMDGAMSPRKGGPRFVSHDDKARAEALLADPRTNEQMAADILLHLLQVAAQVDPHTVLGSAAQPVRVLASLEDVESHTGFGRIEGSPTPVSMDTVDRYICDAGMVPLVFDDDGECLNVGRDRRLFTRKQRLALAVRDGGCMVPDCDRPPSWTEAHHVKHWKRDHGPTDLVDGILLCRRHHQMLHDNGWEISMQQSDYWLIPPMDVDPDRTPIAMHSKNKDLIDKVTRRRAG